MTPAYAETTYTRPYTLLGSRSMMFRSTSSKRDIEVPPIFSTLINSRFRVVGDGSGFVRLPGTGDDTSTRRRRHPSAAGNRPARPTLKQEDPRRRAGVR